MLDPDCSDPRTRINRKGTNMRRNDYDRARATSPGGIKLLGMDKRVIAILAVLVFAAESLDAVQGTCRTVNLLTSDFADATGPYLPSEYLSIQFADVDGDGEEDLCYRDAKPAGQLQLRIS